MSIEKQGISQNKKLKYTISFVVIFLFLLAVGIFYYTFNPEESHFLPECLFHKMTGLDCPGCGSQRAIHNLLHLHIKEAFFYNPLLICSIPYILLCIYMEYFGGKDRYPRIRRTLYSKSAILSILVIILMYWIGRNIVLYYFTGLQL